MLVMDAKSREVQLRRWADRLGLSLAKSRKALGTTNRGGYALFVNRPLYGSFFQLSLDDVEKILQDKENVIRRGEELAAAGEPTLRPNDPRLLEGFDEEEFDKFM